MKILIASQIFPEAVEQLRQRHDVVCAFGADSERLGALIPDREALVFRSGVSIDAALMARAPGLKYLIRAGSGLDNLDMDYVESHGIELVRIPGPGARAVAELGFALMLALARQVRVADGLLRQGRWAKNQIQGYLLAGKTLGVYGMGSIGSLIGRMGAAWDMRVVGCVATPTSGRAADFARHGLTLAPPEEVLASADFLTINVPLREATRNLIDARAIGRMKRGSFLVNLARGGIVDEQALLQALVSGQLAGAGLDVHEREGEGKVSPLAALDNVLLTPHIGANTVDSQRAIGEQVLEIIGARS